MSDIKPGKQIVYISALAPTASQHRVVETMGAILHHVTSWSVDTFEAAQDVAFANDYINTPQFTSLIADYPHLTVWQFVYEQGVTMFRKVYEPRPLRDAFKDDRLPEYTSAITVSTAPYHDTPPTPLKIPVTRNDLAESNLAATPHETWRDVANQPLEYEPMPQDTYELIEDDEIYGDSDELTTVFEQAIADANTAIVNLQLQKRTALLELVIAELKEAVWDGLPDQDLVIDAVHRSNGDIYAVVVGNMLISVFFRADTDWSDCYLDDDYVGINLALRVSEHNDEIATRYCDTLLNVQTSLAYFLKLGIINGLL